MDTPTTLEEAQREIARLREIITIEQRRANEAARNEIARALRPSFAQIRQAAGMPMDAELGAAVLRTAETLFLVLETKGVKLA